MGIALPDNLKVAESNPEDVNRVKGQGKGLAAIHYDRTRNEIILHTALFMGFIGILNASMRLLIIGTIASNAFLVSMSVTMYMLSIWWRMRKQVPIHFVGEKMIVILTCWISYLTILSGGLVGPVFPMLIVLPLIAVMVSGQKALAIILGYLLVFVPFIFVLSETYPRFQRLLIDPEDLFLMRTTIMILCTSMIGVLGWYFYAANQKLLDIISLQANTDFLTGLLSRRSFEGCLEAEIKRMARNSLPLTVVIMDIDNFKSINDNYGHLAGDTCLKHLSGLILESLKRPGDIAGRYGGEEFVLVLPETDAKGGLLVAETLRKKVIANPVPLPHEDKLEMTVSLGVCSAEASSRLTGAMLLKEADRMMYAGKFSGKNRVKGTVIADERNPKFKLAEMAI